MNSDFRDMLFALLGENAEFLVVGAYALAAHGNTRTTGDIDILVRPTPENARRVRQALLKFGAPVRDLSEQELCSPDLVFQMGVAPHRIDILTEIDGLDFEAAWASRATTYVNGRSIPVLGLNALLINKRAVGRPKDLGDVAWIEAKLKSQNHP